MTIVLAMIVRDEAHTVARTIASALPWVDSWTIADTGSADGTAAEVVRACQGKPGQLLRVPFVDFAQARNAVLDAIEPGAVALWLDADDELTNGGALRCMLACAGGNAWSLQHQWSDGQAFTRPTLVRAGTGWRYQGAVHEVLRHQTERATTIIGPGIYQARSPRSDAKSRARQPWDVMQLQALVADHPNDPRWGVYLARTQASLALAGAPVGAADGPTGCYGAPK